MSWLDQPVGKTGRTVREEIVKQLIDQPLHFTWAFTGTILPFITHPAFSRSGWFFFGLGVVVAAVNAAAIIWREVDQWPPSKRPWDPFVDWTFYGLGAGAALWIGLVVLL